jgi:hypothetical protein
MQQPPSPRRDTRIRLDETGCGSLIIGGHDISSYVMGFTLARPHGRGGVATLDLEVAPGSVEADAPVQVVGELREALIALGWAPPPGEHEKDAAGPEAADGLR